MAGLGMYRGDVPVLVGSAFAEWDDVVDLVGAELVADVADAHIPLEDASASGLLSSTAERHP
jgi:hypothetical protein